MDKEMTFEEKLEQLKSICYQLEQNALSLEKVMLLYEEGTKLSKELQNELDNAIKRYEAIDTIEIINNSK